MDARNEQVRALLLGRRKVQAVTIPGSEDTELQAGVRILLEEEIDECRLEATEWIKKKAAAIKLDPAMLLSIDAELLDREIERQIIYRAFVDLEKKPDAHDYDPFFQAPQAIRQLDSVMVRTLFEIYSNHQQYVNPLKGLEPEEAKELAEALGKVHGAEAILGQYDAPALRLLVHILAAQLRSAPTGK